MSVHAIEEIVKKLDEAFGHSDLEAVLGFYEDDAILVAEPDRLARGKEEIERFFMHVFALRGRVEQIETNVLEAGGALHFLRQDGASLEQCLMERRLRRSRLRPAYSVKDGTASGGWPLITPMVQRSSRKPVHSALSGFPR